ncbi:MipA/OmpV family protein [Aestuariicoccus sp. MJ-SS9]|uniref:MipA/OmpV family protein n=1 Tax=Aestuariicoccus sp. MJ-SS9 TaxID=3079855 RepID=UPI0029073F76|nr:MipA/OmpV family protein [Aestuariicoccus sp. MJ-SS9]MDU8912945.1 MipA/OmpV family protein [Aestuariicoccus sp. MJ-SS9]
MTLRLVSPLCLALAVASPLAAAGPEPVAQEPVVMPAQPDRAFIFSLRGGIAAVPEYFGSDTLALGPDVGFSFHYLSLGNGRSFGDPDPWADSTGLSFGGSLRYIAPRSEDDYSELAGLDDIDAALELGVSVSYATRNFETFGALRRGFGGHEGWVAELGADVIARPTDRLRLTAGPRLLWGDDSYTGTYFGVTGTEASAALPAYDPDGGLVSAGIELGARYQINEDWGLEGAITWDTFVGDAQDSPIVRQGATDQWGVRLGVTRVFRIGG